MVRKLIVEAIGTFFLVLTIGQVVLGDAGGFAPLAIGGALMALVFAGGHISGAHYNPAVTLAVWMRGKCASTEVPGYMLSQLIGGVLASVVVLYLNEGAAMTTTAPAVVPALIAEFLFTFALCYVILNVATAKGTAGNSYYGLAIGFTVMAGAFAVGGISGGAFNPAVALSLVVMNLVDWGSLWIYLLANLSGGAAAAALFAWLDMGDDRRLHAGAEEVERAAATS
jgi:aquaporin Z